MDEINLIIDSIDKPVARSKRDKRILRNIINKMISTGSYPETFRELNIKVFRENINVLLSIGLRIDEIPDFMMDNSQLFKYGIKDMVKNYTELQKNKIFSSNIELQKRFFGEDSLELIGDLSKQNIVEKRRSIFKLLKLKKENLPPHLFELCTDSEGLFELTNILLEEEIKKGIKLSDRNCEKLVELDKERLEAFTITKKISNRYQYLFEGSQSIFYEKINSLCPGWYDQFVTLLNNGELDDFLYSLTTINNWNKIENEEDKRVYLKNEIIARILYVALSENKDFNTLDLKTLLTKATGKDEDIFKDNNIVNQLLKIHPYAFDAFRGSIELIKKYGKKAMDSGYLFDKDDYLLKQLRSNPNDFIDSIEPNATEERKTELTRNITTFLRIIRDTSKKNYSKKAITDAINNRIWSSEELVRSHVLDVIYNFVKNPNLFEKNLFKYMRYIDFFISTNGEEIVQHHKKDDLIEARELLFSRRSKYKTEDKLFFTLYNLNRLAHSMEELQRDPYFETINLNKEQKSRLWQFIKTTSDLHLSDNLEEVKDFVIKLKQMGIVDEQAVAQLLKKEPWAKKANLTETNIKNIISLANEMGQDEFNFISADLPKIKYLSKQREVFFESKRIVATKCLEKMICDYGDIPDHTKITTKHLDMILKMNEEEKIAFYNEHGYIIEFQTSLDESSRLGAASLMELSPTMVIYSKNFKEPFSIHIQNWPEAIGKTLFEHLKSVDYESTIAYAQLRSPGLSLRKDKLGMKKKFSQYNYHDNNEIALVTEAGFQENKKATELSIALFNYLKYDIRGKNISLDDISLVTQIVNQEFDFNYGNKKIIFEGKKGEKLDNIIKEVIPSNNKTI